MLRCSSLCAITLLVSVRRSWWPFVLLVRVLLVRVLLVRVLLVRVLLVRLVLTVVVYYQHIYALLWLPPLPSVGLVYQTEVLRLFEQTVYAFAVVHGKGKETKEEEV